MTELPVMMSDETEGTDNGVPFGLLMWGQAGIYNGVDDRMVIAALADSAVGIVRPTRLSAGPGLQVNVAAGWLAIASCDDGTRAVVGSRQTHVLAEAGGPVTGERIDHVWIDTDPDNARWEMRLIPQGTTVGRPGVSIGRVTVPAGANLATQFSFSSLVPTIGRHANADAITNTGTSLMRLTPHYPIAPDQIRPHRVFRVRAWGQGAMGAATSHVRFRSALAGSPVLELNTTRPSAYHSGFPPRANFWWEAEVQYQVNPAGDGLRSMVKALISRGDTWTGYDMSVSGVRVAWGAAFNPDWSEIQVQGAFTGVSAGQELVSHGSTYEAYEPYNA